MRSYFQFTAVLLLLVSPAFFVGCGGTGAAVKGSSSASSEAADAAGGLNKTDVPGAGAAKADAGKADAPKADAPKADAPKGEAEPAAEPKKKTE